MHRISLLFIALLFTSLLQAQVVEATVKQQMPLLKPEEKILIENFASRLEDYINSNEWAKQPDSEIIVNVNISVIIQSVSEGSNGYNYVAQFLIASESGERFYDKAFSFPFRTDELWIYPITSFHPITSFVQYYILMVLGGEMDTYEQYGGDYYYNEVLSICNEGKRSSYPGGWETREELALAYLKEFQRPLRYSKLIYYDAENAYNEGKIAEAQKIGLEILDQLEKTARYEGNSRPMETYLEANGRNIAKLFTDYENREGIYNRLVQLNSLYKSDYKKILQIED
jgi:hypothetical protein